MSCYSLLTESFFQYNEDKKIFMISYLKQASVLFWPFWQSVLTGLLYHPLWQTCRERSGLMSHGKLRLRKVILTQRTECKGYLCSHDSFCSLWSWQWWSGAAQAEPTCASPNTGCGLHTCSCHSLPAWPWAGLLRFSPTPWRSSGKTPDGQSRSRTESSSLDLSAYSVLRIARSTVKNAAVSCEGVSVSANSVWSPYLFIGLQSQWVALFVFKGGGWLHAILTYAYVLYQIIMRTFGLGKLLCFCATTLSWKILIPNPSSGGNSCHILYMCDLRDKEWSKVPLCVHTPLCVVPDSSHSDLR